jgi:hypothetical protein
VIFEQLGDRPGMASTFCNMGGIYTDTGRVADAVPLNLQGLTLSLGTKSPDSGKDLYWLCHQRSILGAETFSVVLADHLDAAGVTNILTLLDTFEAERGRGEPASAPPDSA